MSDKIKGALAIIIAMFVFTSVRAFLKTVDHSYSIIQILFIRNLFALIPYFIMLIANREWESLKIDNKTIYICRALLSVVSLGCLYKSLMLLPLSEATTLSYLSCLIIVLLAAPLLGERITRLGLFSVSLGFVGVMFVVQPSGDVLNIGTVLALISACLEAFLMVHGRLLTTKHSNSAIVLYQGIFACLFVALPLPFIWETPNSYDLFIFITLGIGGGIGQYLITAAYRHAPSALLSPMIYTSLLWTLAYSIFLFDEILTPSLYIGSSLIVIAGLLVMYPENRLSAKLADYGK